jgi:hypothetical protein
MILDVLQSLEEISQTNFKLDYQMHAAIADVFLR